MLTNSTQHWEPGQQVRVGFPTLTVRTAVPTLGDGQPEAYLLINATGTPLYRFVPHRGIEKLDIEEPREILAGVAACGDRAAAAVLAKAQGDARAVAAINDLLAA